MRLVKIAGQCLGLIALLMAAGCAAKQVALLPNNLHLKPAADGSGALVWAKPGLTAQDIRHYDKIMLDRVRVWYSPQAEYKGIDPAQLKMLTEYFHQTMVKHLEKAYKLTDKPGPQVLVIQAAITDLKPADPLRNTLSTFLPVGIALNMATTAATGSGLGVGEATVEVLAMDGPSGDVLYAYAEHQTGSKLEVGQVLSTWGQVKAIFDQWAIRLRARLDKVYGRQ